MQKLVKGLEGDKIGRTERLMVIDNRHRDKNGEISKKHGNTLVRTLRKHYGANFAKDCAENEKLSNVLNEMDEPSLTKLLKDHENGRLEEVCRDMPDRGLIHHLSRTYRAVQCIANSSRISSAT